MSNLHETVDRLKSSVFERYGRRPFARGYLSYRQQHLPRYVRADFPQHGGHLPRDWGLWLDERAVEYPWFFSRLPVSAGRLLDAGSVLNYDYVLSHPKLSNKHISILTLAPEQQCFWQRGLSYVFGDLRDCCFRDGYFDYIVSISTLEHIGLNNVRFYTHDGSKNESDPESHLIAVVELRRILKEGGSLFLTLPYGRREMRDWLQVFDAPRVAKLISTFGPASISLDYYRYTPEGWQVSSAADCRDAGYFDSSAVAETGTDLAAAEAIVCLEMRK